MYNVQTAGTTKYDVTSVANFAKWGGGYPPCTANPQCRRHQGGSFAVLWGAPLEGVRKNPPF